MAISESDIIAELTDTKPGPGLDDYFVIGYDICAVDSNGTLGSLLVEDLEGEAPGEMHFAVVDFLRRRGGKHYETYKEYFDQRNGS